MKSISTQLFMPFYIFLALFLYQTATAQVAVEVEVTSNVFTPSDITVNVGDTVIWRNISGFHNVNGDMDTYPDNAEFFRNGFASNEMWVFTHVFTVEGSNTYQCDPHLALGMIGTVTVEAAVVNVEELSEYSESAIENVFPVPANEFLVVELTETLVSADANLTAVVYDLMGKEIVRQTNINQANLRFNTQDWTPSIYVLQIVNNDQVIDSKKIMKQ